MEISESELLCVYRLAKQSLHAERTTASSDLLYASAEEQLSKLLARIGRRLRVGSGWFSTVSLGQLWAVPKRLEFANEPLGLSFIGAVRQRRIRQFHLRLHLDPPIEFATIEMVWLRRFGPSLETVLTPDAVANRLRLQDFGSDLNVNGRGAFEYWQPQYVRFREGALREARQLLRRSDGECVLASFDLASYYDEIDPQFLVSSDFLEAVSRTAAMKGIEFNREEYLTATETLLGVFARYREAAYKRTFQDNSLKYPFTRYKGFKPLPPGYRSRRP